MIVALVMAFGGVVAVANSAPVASAQSESDAQARIRARFELIRAHSSFNAWTNVDEDSAVQQSRSVDRSPLTGKVVAIKDNIDLSWLPTSAGALALKDRRPTRNATVVDRLLAAGAIIPGHTNMDTWARGVRTVSETTGSTANARNPKLGPMGSSGGTATAVALGDADAGLGTDTCGSIRYPAAANLLYGLRPTAGLVSRSGVVPLSPTQDVVGPIGPTVESLATILDVIAGPDDRDALTQTAPERTRTYADLLQSVDPSRAWRVGVIRSLGGYRPDLAGTTMLDRLRAAGVELVEVALPSIPTASVIDIESRITRSLVLAGVDETRWIPTAAWPLEPSSNRTYRQLLASRKTVAQRLTSLLDTNKLDALVYPTTPFLPAPRGARQSSGNCHLAATSGLPALAVPHGMGPNGTPVPGIDLLGRPFDEATLLALAQRIEASTPAASSQ